MDSLPGGGMLWVPPSQGNWSQDGCLLFYIPPRIPLAAHHSTETTKITEQYSDNDITLETTSLCVFLWCVCVEVISPMSEVRPPCLNVCVWVCVSACAHLRSPTRASIWYRLPTEVLCFDREGERGRGGGGGEFFFFFLLAVENGGAFYDPCSLSSCKNHTRRFPALQHHRLRSQWKQWSVWRRNKANKEREREKKVFLDGNTCRSTLYIYIILSLPIRLWGRPLTHSHTLRNL